MHYYRNKLTNGIEEAMQFTVDNRDQCMAFITCYRMPGWDAAGNICINMQHQDTLTRITIDLGDYIIKNHLGKFYPLTEDEFNSIYEPIETEKHTTCSQEVKNLLASSKALVNYLDDEMEYSRIVVNDKLRNLVAEVQKAIAKAKLA
jgi:hypothetical protein